ncbi:hypothetical protein PVAG01_04298 [Phlyctema vagabunda]|uniref:Uncharacterized protein n=1 Tax=Phlyctema vagabunda TaxID=108571 RepID=A0ABR4PPI3_9HELO
MADKTLERLLTVLRDRNIAFDKTAIESAFRDADSQAAVKGWVEEYLTENTLLTKEESTLYASLKKSGEYEAISASHDLTVIPSLNDLDLQLAIDELKRSTAAIEKQTETLKLQQNAMSMLVKNNGHVDKARAQSNNNQIRRWEVENGQIAATVEEMTENLSYQTLELQQQVKASEANVKQTVDAVLKSDDKLLSSLQKLSNDLEPSQSTDDVLIEKIRELCARLIKHTVQGVRTKLDRIYLEALSEANGDAKTSETEELQEELESLYAEILPVAQMTAEQQYLEPALREIKARSGQGQQRTEVAVAYVCASPNCGLKLTFCRSTNVLCSL